MKIRHLKESIKASYPNLWNFLHKARLIYYRLQVEQQREKLPDLIKQYYKTTNDSEVIEILSYLVTNSIAMIPYEFTKDCKARSITIMRDDKLSYPYVIIGGNKVYFPKISDLEIRESVISALIEQHDQSPHKYLTDQFKIDDGDTALFVGASDGIFCLSIIEKAKKVYLFEPDIEWIAPLNLTFAPWKEKVEIIQKCVSNKNDSQNVSLDTFLSSRNEHVNYLQADIEGTEKELLLGASYTLENSIKLKLSICCYHKQRDQAELSEFLLSKSYQISYSKGYMIMWMQLPCGTPYLRKGVIYASRS